MSAPPRVVLACPGLDHARRGFETFARECFTALRGRDDVEIELVTGTGPRAPGERPVPTLVRDAAPARALGRALRRPPFVVEHVAFAAALAPLLARRRPDVVYFSEWHLGRVLGAWPRRPFGLVFCNGALVAGGYGHLDRVQQLVPEAIAFSTARGEPAEGQVFLPLGVAIDAAPAWPRAEERAALRSRLRLPQDRRVVLSAGAVNRQKRVDHLIEEVAAMPEPRPFLLLAGQQEPETPALARLALERLGPHGHDVRTVAPERMPDLYRAADAFVLASLWESFGRVLVEAQSHGLPCLAHEHPVMSWVLGDAGDTADLTRPGAIASWLGTLGDEALSPAARAERHRAGYERFSWDRLAARYADMLGSVAEERRAAMHRPR